MEKWRINVDVVRSTKDEYQDVITQTVAVVPGALFDPGSSTTPDGQSALTDNRAKLYFEKPVHDIRNGDTVRFQSLAANYSFKVNGKPLIYPMGTVVILDA